MPASGFKAAAALIAALAFSVGGAARADEGITLQGGVEAMNEGGQTVGCQATFGVVKHDKENFANGSVLALGSLSLLSVSGKARVVLKIGLFNDTGDDGDVSAHVPVPPAGVVLLEDGGDPAVNNAAESLGAAPPEKGFGLFLFDVGPVTRQVLAQAARNGRFKVVYVVQAGGRPSRFAVDLTVAKRDLMHSDNTVIDPKAPDILAACLAKVVK